MKRHTIRCLGIIQGTFLGNNEQEALDAMAKDRGFPDFASWCESKGITRDHHTVQVIKD